MKAPFSWIQELAGLPSDVTAQQLAAEFTRVGLQVERIDTPADAITGAVVVGQVLSFVEEPQKNGKTIRWCQVDVGTHNPMGAPARGIVCGALNFIAGDYVAVALAGAVLPGGFEIAARKTYGHISDGMICAADELGLGSDHSGIMVLDATLAATLLGQDALSILGAYESVFEIDVTPDMGYCLSIRGLAREAAQAFGLEFRDPYATPVPPATQAGYPVLLASSNCPTFSALSVHGVDPNAPTPDWMVSRLAACGTRSLGLAIDVTNYVMYESGQPIHGYDASKLVGSIVVRQAVPGEHITTLDGIARTLVPDDLLITDDSGPIGLAGVMGGLTTELDVGKTTEILIEAAQFDPITLGRTYRRLALASEASRRFERGVDAGVGFAAGLRCAELLRELAGGVIDAAYTVAGEVTTPPTCSFPATLPSNILGVEISIDKVLSILSASGVTVTFSDETLTCAPPTWRRDLIDSYDYVEEIAQKIGYDSIPVVTPQANVGRGLTREQTLRRTVVHAVATAGFTEVLTLPFVGLAELSGLHISAGDVRYRAVRLANPLSEEQAYLRTTLLTGLVAAANRNTSRSLDDLALFESGAVFWDTSTAPTPLPGVSGRPSDAEITALYQSLPAQPHMLAALLCGAWVPPSWQTPAVPADWTHALRFAEVAATTLGIELVRRAATVTPWHPGRCAELGVFSSDGEFVTLGYAGELHPDVVKTLGLPTRACAVELNLDELLMQAPHASEVRALSQFPLTKQDVALVVDTATPAVAVESALLAGAGDLLESLALFDVYSGAQLGEGKKSLAYSLRFRHAERTLTEAEATAARDAAVAAATAATGAVLRA
ncbi:MAG: phenylalanine--tRNA ligase subunit beta [Propionibacteriaceae bacterium]|jgi:phenylalanyl-tRNA synthetase beta chain|nr:phenylalanine--tRNA ligase subunit beta [Propionibacteriaceae bacterium]